MESLIRLGAVVYLNARPLTWVLDRHPDRWEVRYDVPSVCAQLLHHDDVDLGLIPSIEYLQRPDYRFVPGVGIGSRGEIASVALYTRKELRDVRTLALDTSSRTSHGFQARTACSSPSLPLRVTSFGEPSRMRRRSASRRGRCRSAPCRKPQDSGSAFR